MKKPFILITKKDYKPLWLIFFVALTIGCYTSETLAPIKDLGGVFITVVIFISFEIGKET